MRPHTMNQAMTRPSVVVVVTFFGRAPLWLPAFFLSCRGNPDVQWIIYTDVTLSGAIPANVTLKPMNFRELSLRTSKAFGIPIEIRRPRKLCDLKLTYGVIFADDLRPFDFWACSDLDVIWGDIRQFVTDARLNDYDIISSRSSRLSGHFTLFRNTAEVNRTFELIPDVALAMANTAYRHLDERELTRYLRAHLNGPPPRSAPRVYWQEEWTVDAAYQKAMGEADRLWWRNGKTFDAQGKERMYMHFHKLKQDMKTINFGMEDSPTAFAIDREGFTA